ncbi:MAG: hypothetical protein ABH812_00935 [bacterium]
MIKKILVALLLLYKVASVYSAENIAGNSAMLSDNYNQTSSEREAKNLSVYDYNLKRNTILKVLSKHNSPLTNSANTFVETCLKHDLDCYLLPAISGLESTYGKAVIAGTYNPFGWGAGSIHFESWNEAIETVGTGFENNYIAKGATSIEQIGNIYAASPTWASRIYGFMSEFEQAEQTGNLEYNGLEIKL